MKTLANLINAMNFQESLELAKEIVDSRLAAILSESDHVRRVVAIENGMKAPEEDTARKVSVGVENPDNIIVYYSREATHKFLMSLGIRPHNKGFRYLESALKILHKDETYLDKVTVLYHVVAKMHDSTSGGVERSIRHVIAGLTTENLLKIAPTCGGDHCTNKEFITYLLLLYKEYINR